MLRYSIIIIEYVYTEVGKNVQRSRYLLGLQVPFFVHGGIQLFFSPPGEGEAGAKYQYEQCSLF